MRRRVGPALVLVAAFLLVTHTGATSRGFPLLPNVHEIERQVRFDLESLGGIFEFQSPSVPRFSITYLTMEEVRRDALYLQALNLHPQPGTSETR